MRLSAIKQQSIMEAKFTISEVFGKALKSTKSQIWVLAGLLISFAIISFTLGVFAMPMQQSVVGQIVVNLISIVLSAVFNLGYLKNLFQTLDGIEPQFSAYGQQSRKIITYIATSVLLSVIVILGMVLFIIPGIYLALRLQFASAFIVEEDAGIMESLKQSWKITEGQTMQLFLLMLVMIGIVLIGLIVFVVGIFFAIPIVYMMYCMTFRKLNTPLQILEEA